MNFDRERVKMSAAILAGGKNTRIGTEKSLLKIKDEPIIDGMVELLEQMFPEVIISTSKVSLKNRFPNGIFCEDLYKETGPLAGIHSILKMASYDAVFIFACDMPHLNRLLIQLMIEYYTSLEEGSILVPRHSEGIEPLHSIYHKKHIPLIEKQIENGRCKITDFVKGAEAKYLDIRDEDKKHFFNINTKRDYDSITKELLKGNN